MRCSRTMPRDSLRLSRHGDLVESSGSRTSSNWPQRNKRSASGWSSTSTPTSVDRHCRNEGHGAVEVVLVDVLDHRTSVLHDRKDVTTARVVPRSQISRGPRLHSILAEQDIVDLLRDCWSALYTRPGSRHRRSTQLVCSSRRPLRTMQARMVSLSVQWWDALACTREYVE